MSFQLVETAEDGYTWKSHEKLYFKGQDTTIMFPMIANLYLKVCSLSELDKSLMSDYVVRMQCYYGENDESFITGTCLDVSGFNSEFFRDLYRRNPFNTVNFTIEVGPFWHYFGIDKTMWVNRHITTGYLLPQVGGYIIGMRLYGRDNYPNEDTDEKIAEMEEIEDIFILHRH